MTTTLFQFKAAPLTQNSPSATQTSADDMTYISPEESDLLFKLTDPELYAALNGGSK